MFRVVVLFKNTETKGKNCNTRAEVDEWLLSMLDKGNVKRYRILDKKTGNIIETEEGRRDKKK